MPSNPILPGFNPDPSICRVKDKFYLATSTFEYFPGVPIYSSSNLVDWELLGHALNRPSQLQLRSVPPGGGVYAPTLRHYKGRFYMTTAICYGRVSGMHFEPRGFYVWTDNIEDETTWSDPVYFDQLGIDQDLFFDDDDKVYLCTSRSNHGKRQAAGSYLLTYGCEIELSTGKSLTPPILLRYNTVKDEGGGVAEGPHIYKLNGWYYLLTAEGGTGSNHQCWIQRSRSPLGPYKQPPEGVNPLMYNREGESEIGATGHADFVEDEAGNWWAVMLAIHLHPSTGPVMGTVGRQPYLCPLQWNENGWPILNNGTMMSRRVQTDLLPEAAESASFLDDFSSTDLNKHWYHLRTPLKPIHSLSERPDYLTLYGSAYGIGDQESPAMVLRKLPIPCGTWTTEMEFDPASEHEEAGTTVYLSLHSYLALSVRRDADGQRKVTLRWPEDQMETKFVEEERDLAKSNGPICFEIKMSQTEYVCKYKEASDGYDTHYNAFRSIATTAILKDRPLDSNFTGVMLGLFAQGMDGEACQSAAYFKYASFVSEPV